jgi:hypothetical protein
MLLVRAILSKGIRILADIGATHNVINSNVTCMISLVECHITTTVLVGSDTKLACRGASFTIPLRIHTKTFQIDAFLLSIGDDIDVILGAPCLADVENTPWNFTSLEMQFHWSNCMVTFTSIPDHRAPLQPLTPAPPASTPAPPPATWPVAPTAQLPRLSSPTPATMMHRPAA